MVVYVGKGAIGYLFSLIRAAVVSARMACPNPTGLSTLVPPPKRVFRHGRQGASFVSTCGLLHNPFRRRQLPFPSHAATEQIKTTYFYGENYPNFFVR